MSLLSSDTITITRPDYAEPWSAKQVIPALTFFFTVVAVLCTFGTGFTLVAIFFELLAGLCWLLTLVGIVYTGYQYRYWIRYISSNHKYKCLISPKMSSWFYNRHVFALNGVSREKCIVPSVHLSGDHFKILILPNTLKILTDPQFATELESYIYQHGCKVSILPGQRRGGYVVYTIRPDVRRDRLSYGE